MLIKGSDLNPRQRELVLNQFVHRWTHENANQTYGGECPACAQQRQCGGAMEVDGHPWHEHHLPLMSDDAWVRDHAFYFVKDGSRLMEKRHAEPAYMADQ